MTNRIHVPSLLGGISQQSDAIRAEDTVEDALNVEFLAQEGATKRYGTELIRRIPVNLHSDPRCVWLQRDDADYVLVIEDTVVTAYDLSDGTEIPVLDDSNSGGGYAADFSYLNSSTSSLDIRHQTVADAIFVLNKQETVLRLPGKTLPSWARPTSGVVKGKGEAGYFVKQANLGVNYEIEIQTASMVSGGVDPIKVRYQIPDETFNASGRVPYSGTPVSIALTANQANGTDPIQLVTSPIPGNVGGIWRTLLRNVTGSVPFNDVFDFKFRQGATDIPVSDFEADPYTSELRYVGTTPLSTGTNLDIYREDVTIDFFLRTDIVLRSMNARILDLFPAATTEFNIGDSALRISFNEEIVKFEVRDSEANTFSSGWTNTVENLTDLPTTFRHGAVVQVAGANTDAADDYYLEFATEEWFRDTDGDLDQFDSYDDRFGQGVWNETTKRELADGSFDASTMPHVLERKVAETSFAGLSPGDIYFNWRAYDWSDRSAGDDNLAPEPSFVGEKINSIFFHQNRLGFLSNSELIASETSVPENFWRTTVLALPDSDPIDVAIVGLDGDNLNHAIEFDERLFVFGDEGQAAVFGRGVFSPKTIEAPVVSAYRSFRDIEPVRLGRSMFFGEASGQYAQIREYIPGTQSERFEDLIITLNASKLVPVDIRELFVGSVTQIMGARDAEDTNRLYLYQYFRLGQDQLQASWTRWDFPGIEEILGCGFVDDVLYLLVQRDGDTHLEKILLGAGRTDTGQDFAIRVDCLRAGTSATYDKGQDITSYLSLFSVPAGSELVAVVTASVDPDLPYGAELPVTINSTGFPASLSVPGDTTGVTISFGFRYSSTVVLSKPLVKGDFRGGRSALLGGSSMVRDVTLYLANTGYMRASVAYANAEASEEEFVDNVLGVADFDQTLLRSGEFKVPVHAHPEECSITLTNDSPLPSTIVSAAWAIRYRNRHRLS